ncbi:Rieske (2Fe-2S) protein [Aurantiacibacter poecillastricola]|uniref:Rieske (2Fe-2S) protein n=1 Tax=Aurantiacibacter poecillastricola TaxID=3064385 RepID=UPI00273F7720|nr:Rieske 2Fe-2S domain-containing protein [Aurantiacibacter sp. 219JJ12-13]MDP5261255.1 Rieske 2Fe-2S domain-containing protein [Aurantiacibacter sp. 219JJ12-13]
MSNQKTDGLKTIMVCAETDIPTDGSVITRSVEGQQIALARHNPGSKRVIAFESRCPHMQAPLKFGRVVDGEVVCPWHFFRFDTETGNTIACPNSEMHLATFTVEQRDGNVLVQLNSESSDRAVSQ